MPIGSIANSEDGLSVRNKLNKGLARADAPAFIDVNYAGSFNPSTDDSANFINAVNAVANDADGVRRVHVGPGWLNLSGMTAGPLAPTGKDFELHFWGTQVVGGTFINGTSSHPVNARNLLRLQKGCGKVSIVCHYGACFHGFNYLIIANNDTNIYATKADWGTRLPEVRFENIAMRRCLGGVFFANFDTIANAEALERNLGPITGSNPNRVIGPDVVGDGATTFTIKINQMETRSDTGANKIQPGDVLGMACVRNQYGDLRDFRGVVSQTVDNGDGTWNIVFHNAIPAGFRVRGNEGTTLNGAHGTSTGTKLTVNSSANTFKGSVVQVTYDDATTALLWVYDIIDGTHISLSDPLTKAAGNGKAVDGGSGSQLQRIYEPAVTFEKAFLSVAEKGIEILPTDTNPQRIFYCGNVAHTVVIKKIEIVAVTRGVSYISGGRQFTISADSTSRASELYMDYARVDGIVFRDHLSLDGTSGGIVQLLGPQEAACIDCTFEGDTRRSVNQANLTLTAAIAISQQYVEVTQDITAVVKYGYSINATTGEPNTSSITAINVNSGTTSTVNNPGGYSLGATDIVLASAASFSVGDVIGYTSTVSGNPTQRYNAISAKVSNTITLKEALDGSLADGATVTRLRSNKSSAAARGETNTNIIRLTGTSVLHPVGRVHPARIVAVDTTRGVGHHRIYFQDPAIGWTPAGDTVYHVDNNWFTNNGDEQLYAKGTPRFRGLTFRNAYSTHEGIVSFKGGEPGKTAFTGGQNNPAHEGGISDTIFSTDLVRAQDPAASDQRAIFVQSWAVTIGPNVWMDEQWGDFINTHNQTPCSKLRVVQSGIRRARGGRFGSILCPGGHEFEFRECKSIFHPQANSANHGISLIHASTPGPNDTGAPRADFRDIRIVDLEHDTTLMMKEDAGTGTSADRIAAVSIGGDFGQIGALVCIRDVFIDGYMGRSNFCSFLEVRDAQRIVGVRLGSQLDITGYKGTKCDLIKLESNSSGTVSTAMLSTTTTATQAAGDRQVSIADRFAYNIPAGSPIVVTLDVGTLSTWVAADTGEHAPTGVVLLVDPIPAGRTVANGATVTFRPVGQIELDSPRAIGYEFEEDVRVASGANSFTWSIAGKFIKYRHSPGAPDAGQFFVKGTKSGDVLYKDFLAYVAPADVTANDNAQAGGQVVFRFVDYAGAARNMAADTILRVGFRVPYLRFNA